jgi:hypothetical protein
MKAPTPQERIRLAEAELDAAHAALARDTDPIRTSFRRHRGAWIVGGGLVGGFALSWLPTRLWARVGAIVGGGAALAARSMLTPMIAGALMSRQPSADADGIAPPNDT